VELTRPDGRVGTLTQPGQPTRRIALQRRSNPECLVEELRRLDPDEVFEAALHGLPKIASPTTAAMATSAASAAAKPKAAAAKAPAKKAGKAKAEKSAS
jgi:glucose-6-phosphate dehydrogenase assembly protein OpcA